VLEDSGDVLCNGRLCRHCGKSICRPKAWRQTGMHAAVVCDQCWFDLGVSWKMGLISQRGLADLLGISRHSVQEKFSRTGFISSSIAFSQNRSKMRRHQKPQVREANAVYRANYVRTERGREAVRRGLARYRYKKNLEREEINARNVAV
jgi:hypothetical protein